MDLECRLKGSHLQIDFPCGDKIITLPTEIIKSYLPRLWQSVGRWAKAEGWLDLEGLSIVQGRHCQKALHVILKALKKSQAGCGVASELKAQLDRVRADNANRAPSPEYTMSKIFSNVAKLVRKLGPHQEMAYAMTEWFAIFAAERLIHPESMFQYIIALDRLRVNMTGPLHALLQDYHWDAADIQLICESLRRPTGKRLISLWKDYKKQDSSRRSALPPGRGLIEGGDICLRDILRQYRRDPDSIIVRVGSRNRKLRDWYDSDDGYLTDTDTIDDDEFRPYTLGPPRIRDPSSYHPFHGFPHVPHPLQYPDFPAPPRRCSPLLLEADYPAPLPIRPSPMRVHSAPSFWP
ncbi:MAG: hypothetical protein Q9213_005647 [Squamulea squamosa]